MSSQLKEKQQQESKRQLDADNLLNKHIFNTLAYTFGGYAAGMATSLLFKRKAGIPLLMAGAGAGYGLSNLYGDMERLKKFQGQSGSSNTLKRDDLVGTKDWDKYKTQEEYQHTTKGPRYGGSDDSDDKSGSGKTEQKRTKDNKPEAEVKSGQTRDSGKRETSQRKDEGRETEKSQKGVDSHRDQKKLTNIEGNAYNKSGDSKSKENDSKNTRESESKRSKEDDFKSSRSAGERTSTQRQLDPKLQGTNPKTAAVTSGKSAGGVAHSFDDSPAKGGSRAPGELQEGTSLENRRGGERTQKLKEQMDDQRVSEQDRMGRSVRTGNKMKVEAADENVAGGQFKGRSSAGSQVNAVIE